MQINRVIGALVETQKQVDGLSRQGLHACGGTWTHSAAQAVTTTGTALTFDSQIRNSGISVDATNQQFTVNTGGMFIINLTFNLSANVNFAVRMNINGVSTDQMAINPAGITTARSAIIMKYLQKNHQLSFTAFPATNCNILVAAEDAVSESIILHISQVSPKFTNS